MNICLHVLNPRRDDPVGSDTLLVVKRNRNDSLPPKQSQLIDKPERITNIMLR